jgi:hypothetical protein
MRFKFWIVLFVWTTLGILTYWMSPLLRLPGKPDELTELVARGLIGFIIGLVWWWTVGRKWQHDEHSE